MWISCPVRLVLGRPLRVMQHQAIWEQTEQMSDRGDAEPPLSASSEETMTMNTMMTTASGPADHTADAPAEQADEWQALAARWPEFSAPELRRLHFVTYRLRTGRLHPPKPVSPEVDALCAALLRHTDPSPPSIPPPRPSSVPGVPPLWAAWAAQQRARPRAAAERAPADALWSSERTDKTC